MSTEETPPKKKRVRSKKEKPTPPTPPEQPAPLAAPIIPPTRELIQAPYRFTAEEIGRQNNELRKSLDEIDTLKGQAKAAAQDFKLRIQNKENEALLLRQKLNSGEESRALQAAVLFFPVRSRKHYLHPESGEFIREEEMTAADFQLPLLKQTEEGKEEPAKPADTDAAPPKKSRNAKPPATSPPGATSLGNALDAAVAKTEQPQIVLDLDKSDWTSPGLIQGFRRAAKVAGWPSAAVSAISDRMKECRSVEDMVALLRPHVVGAQQQMGAPEGEPAETEPEATEL